MPSIMEHIDPETGAFKESFGGSIAEFAGEEHKDTKFFDSVPDVATLVKSALDTKSAMGRKMEGVIQKPKENASDEEKAEYRRALLKELGTPEKADDYEFPQPENLPEGMTYNEDVEKEYRQFFFDEGVPAGMVGKIISKFNEVQLARFNTHLAEQQKEFETACTDLNSRWKGDDKIANNRLAFKAIMRFGTEDLTKLLKESKIYENAADHQKWHELGFSPAQRELWYNIGKATKSDEAITDEGLSAKDTSKKTTAQSVYTHPTSQKQLFSGAGKQE